MQWRSCFLLSGHNTALLLLQVGAKIAGSESEASRGRFVNKYHATTCSPLSKGFQVTNKTLLFRTRWIFFSFLSKRNKACTSQSWRYSRVKSGLGVRSIYLRIGLWSLMCCATGISNLNRTMIVSSNFFKNRALVVFHLRSVFLVSLRSSEGKLLLRK